MVEGLRETLRQRNALLVRAKMLASQAQETILTSRDAVARSEQLLQELYELRRFWEGHQSPFGGRAKKAKG